MATYVATALNDPSLFFNTVLFTGDGTDDRAITVGFQPDLSFVLQRTDASGGYITDSVRGNNAALQTTNTNAEGTFADMTFTSTGITVSSNENLNNENAHNYVSWHWKAGTSFSNDASATSVGSVDSTGSINTTSGFSIMSYTGTGSNATVAHGLSAEAKCIIFKDRDTASDWRMYHVGVGNTGALTLNGTNATQTNSVFFQDTTPTSTVFSLGTGTDVNNTNAFIAYCFAEKQGYSKFGKYTGNGNADGTFVYTGFKPALIMYKRYDTTDNWYIKDNKRSGTAAGQNFGQMNPNQTQHPSANTTDVENKASAFSMDILSNGFKLRGTDAGINASSGTYVYLAFAEAPFVNSNGVPCNAR